jgi:two-component system nitrogen regulation response regulator GlnG
MTIRPSLFSILLLSADPDLQTQLKQELKDSAVTVAKDSGSVSRAVKRRFDAVLVETKRGPLSDLNELIDMQRGVDPAHTVILAGPRHALRQASGFVQAMRNGNGRSPNGTGQDLGLENYIEFKLGEFVKGMKNSSAKNLHHMLISAVERPLISLVLKETNGNQIQAAHLLGVNRNTLRKKITELKIPVKREKVRKG